jgi:gamma-glutamylcyclotransferase (GGCT)/AIG2-like uncharacterized protein YtfP
MNPHLFVYGSLMSRAAHPMGDRLRREAKLVGEATLQGRLFAISWYPAAVAGEDPAERVHGEVYALADPARTLRWLDAYEGIVSARPNSAEYERIERPVRLASGEEIAAWVYLYRKDASKLTRIPDGRWTMAAP